MVPWHPTFRICRSTWVKGNFCESRLDSEFGVYFFVHGSSLRGSGCAGTRHADSVKSCVSSPILVFIRSTVHVHVHVMNKTLSAFFCFFFLTVVGLFQHMFNLSVVEIPQLLNSGTKVLPCPKASVPHVLPLGFAAGTRAPRVHVLHTDTSLSYPEYMYSSQALEPRAEKEEPWYNSTVVEWATSV
jgi:hypothetical protein